METGRQSVLTLSSYADFRKPPVLEQIIEPEREIVLRNRVKPRPHPPISRRKILMNLIKSKE